MNKNRFTIIEGNNLKKDNTDRKFISSYATDTRLMGVVGMYIHWKLEGEDFYQLFHFDAEEYGFDNYISLRGDNIDRLAVEKAAMMGGLGGRYVSLKEDEAIYLFQKFMAMNLKKNLPLPEPRIEYAFLYKDKIKLNNNEKKLLMNKISEEIVSEYQAINYFLMRAFSKDEEGMRHLTNQKELSFYDGKSPATLLKNIIEEQKTEAGISYICESLIEESLKYRIEISEIEVKNINGKVYISDAQKRSDLKVSATEAALMLNRSEYVNVYSIEDVPDFVEIFKAKKPQALHNTHSSVDLFTEFNINNNHVKEKIYMLNGDIYGVYCITESGQFIVAGYDLDKIEKIERYLVKSELNEYIALIEKLEFKESVLYEFVNSGYEDFFDFLMDF